VAGFSAKVAAGNAVSHELVLVVGADKILSAAVFQ
jgi:hypothetical protein